MIITSPASRDALLFVANSYHQPEARDEPSKGVTWLPAHDHLETADTAIAYLRRKGVRISGRPDARQLATLRAIRETATLLVTDRRRYLRCAAALLRHKHFELQLDGRIVPTRSGWDGFIDGLLIGLVEMREHADRVKRCANDQCRWLFLDGSKNRSRQWCESASCGNRQRVRRFRHRLEAMS